MKLNKEQKAKVARWVALEVADMMESAWGEPFKDRDYRNPFPNDDELNAAADDYFDTEVKKLAAQLRKTGRP